MHRLPETEITALAELINATRTAQGWAQLPPEEAMPIVLLWYRQFERCGIKSAEYQNLLERAIAFRTAEIKDKKRPTPFSVELFLALKQSVMPLTSNTPEDRNAEMEARGFPKVEYAN